MAEWCGQAAHRADHTVRYRVLARFGGWAGGTSRRMHLAGSPRGAREMDKGNPSRTRMAKDHTIARDGYRDTCGIAESTRSG